MLVQLVINPVIILAIVQAIFFAISSFPLRFSSLYFQ